MGKLLKIWLVILLGAGIGALISHDNGYVLFSAGSYTVEMSLALLAILLGLLFVALYLLIRLIVRTYYLPSDVRGWRQRRGARQAQSAMTRGLLEISEGNWYSAEKRLVRFADRSETPLLNYLAAARAAQLQGAHDRRDAYIRLAHENMPSADVAVSLTQAELQLADHQLEQALATLKHLRDVAPKHTYVLRLLRRLYEQLGDWEQLRQLIPELRRRKVETADDLRQLEIKTHRALLEQAFLSTNPQQLPLAWNNVPKGIRGDTRILSEYVGYLQERKQDHDAEKLLRDALEHAWDTQLVELYGLVACSEPGKHLSRLEELLQTHPNDPVLLLTLGRLSMRAKLWGKARGYLEASVTHKGPVGAYRELGRLLEHMGEHEAARHIYRQALTAGADNNRLIPLPAEIKPQANRPGNAENNNLAVPPAHGAMPAPEAKETA
jgi:HemY protein